MEKKEERIKNKEQAGMKSDFYAITSVVNASTEFDPIGTQYITKPAGTFLNGS